MSDPIRALERLDQHAAELDKLSKELEQTERWLEPVTLEYEAFMGAYEEGLWDRHVTDGEKLPPEALRTRMAHRAMAADLLGRYSSLVAARRRTEKRISSLKSEISAQQSILSALKTEAEASGGGFQRRAA